MSNLVTNSLELQQREVSQNRFCKHDKSEHKHELNISNPRNYQRRNNLAHFLRSRLRNLHPHYTTNGDRYITENGQGMIGSGHFTDPKSI